MIEVLGKDPFGDALLAATAGKTFEGRSFRGAGRERLAGSVTLPNSVRKFLGAKRKRLGLLFSHISDRPVLTVGETDNFTAEGGVVNLKIEDGTIRLQINIEAARKQQLHISAKLLSLAEIVGK